ncbi:hypothetical protein [uncultured Sutterella sp.]|uniref:hypothetical protein n=1 Tax=uncultured Sutterella sp. TaxID=286133 RepID=UPI0025E5CA65|nr:hypothetical protein [uncultured Sutterella sp.]
MTLPFFAAAPAFLEKSNAVCLLPRALAELTLGRFALLPVPAWAPQVSMRLAWCGERDSDPGGQ